MLFVTLDGHRGVLTFLFSSTTSPVIHVNELASFATLNHEWRENSCVHVEPYALSSFYRYCVRCNLSVEFLVACAVGYKCVY